MLTKPARIIWIVTAGLVIIFIAVIGLIPGGLELEITPVHGGEPILVLPLQPGEHFTIRYYHSVENAPIWEVIRVKNRKFFSLLFLSEQCSTSEGCFDQKH